MAPNLGRVAIIGAGPTGLGAALALKEAGHQDFVIYEATPHVGGLASSFVDQKGFTWDIGGHVQFSHYKYFDALMERALGADGWLFHERESWVWMRKRFIPYPFQYNIRHLPAEERKKCLEGIIKTQENPRHIKPENFAQWVIDGFGQGISDVFMEPYNKKVWAYPLEKLSYNWIGERVAVVDVTRLKENIRLERDERSWGPNNTFRFPRHGGTGAIWQSVARLVGLKKIELKTKVVSVNPKKKTMTLSDGRVENYDRLLNTSPIDLFAQTVDGLPETIKALSKKLLYSSTHIVGVGLRGKPKPELATKCWMYFPENDCPFYRTTVFSHYSPNNVPDISRYWSLMTETSESPDKPVDQKKIVEQTIEGLINTQLIKSKSDVESTWYFRAEHGYPTPSVDRDQILKKVQDELSILGISSRGRFGAWKYEVSNQDHSLMQGVEWARHILNGEPELTWTNPSAVNSSTKK